MVSFHSLFVLVAKSLTESLNRNKLIYSNVMCGCIVDVKKDMVFLSTNSQFNSDLHSTELSNETSIQDLNIEKLGVKFGISRNRVELEIEKRVDFDFA